MTNTLWIILFAVLLLHGLIPAEPASPRGRLEAEWRKRRGRE